MRRDTLEGILTHVNKSCGPQSATTPWQNISKVFPARCRPQCAPRIRQIEVGHRQLHQMSCRMHEQNDSGAFDIRSSFRTNVHWHASQSRPAQGSRMGGLEPSLRVRTHLVLHGRAGSRTANKPQHASSYSLATHSPSRTPDEPCISRSAGPPMAVRRVCPGFGQ